MSGQWLAPVRDGHQCRLPMLIPFYVRTGDRWKCTDQLHEGEVCGRIWRVTENASGRMWTWENPDQPDTWKVFRPVTEDQLWYWINAELDLQTQDQDVCAATLVEIIQKHFEIGSRT